MTSSLIFSNRDDINRTAKKVKDQVGDVSILVNNAGTVYGKRLIDTPDEMIERTIRVNLLAYFWVRTFILHFKYCNFHFVEYIILYIVL